MFIFSDFSIVIFSSIFFITQSATATRLDPRTSQVYLAEAAVSSTWVFSVSVRIKCRVATVMNVNQDIGISIEIMLMRVAKVCSHTTSSFYVNYSFFLSP